MRLGSRTPPDRRTPAEPSGPPKSKGTAVKSKAKIAVPQREEARSDSSSSSPEPARGSRLAAAAKASEDRSQEEPGQGANPPEDGGPGEASSPYIKEESEDSCYEPIRLRPAASQEEAHRCLPSLTWGCPCCFVFS